MYGYPSGKIDPGPKSSTIALITLIGSAPNSELQDYARIYFEASGCPRISDLVLSGKLVRMYDIPAQHAQPEPYQDTAGAIQGLLEHINESDGLLEMPCFSFLLKQVVLRAAKS